MYHGWKLIQIRHYTDNLQCCRRYLTTPRITRYGSCMLEVTYFTYFDWIIFLFAVRKRSIFFNYSRVLSVNTIQGMYLEQLIRYDWY